MREKEGGVSVESDEGVWRVMKEREGGVSVESIEGGGGRSECGE